MKVFGSDELARIEEQLRGVMLKVVEPMQKAIAEPNVWAQFMAAALGVLDANSATRAHIEQAANAADVALIEYKKRFGALK
jgi:hypothetical protein